MTKPTKILFISHDANLAGAQYLLYYLLKFLKKEATVETLTLLVKGGGLEDDFRKVTNVIKWENTSIKKKRFRLYNKFVKKTGLSKLSINDNQRKILNNHAIEEIKKFKPDVILSNTIANGEILLYFENLGIPFFIYAHELEKSIQTYTTPKLLQMQLAKSQHILAGSLAVKNNFIKNHDVNAEKITVINSLVECEEIEKRYQSVNKVQILHELNIPNNAIIIGGCGNLEWRKGVDLFINTALQVTNNTERNVHFVWVGAPKDSNEYFNLMYDLERMNLYKCVHLLEPSQDYFKYMACFDIFFLSSREDPYPLVMIEAGLNFNPVICFDNTGGAVNYVGIESGLIIPYLDIVKASSVLIDLIENTEKKIILGTEFYKKAKQHDVAKIAPTILDVLCKNY